MDSSKKTAALTPWFAASVKPVRVGVYEKDFTADLTAREFQFWSGKRWHYGGPTPDDSLIEHEFDGCEPTPRPWRGLASSPEQK